MDRLTGLTVFGSVVDNGGFSAAARRLNMSVTMVSNHVQALEDRLGVRLLNRSTRKVSLTEVGRSYYERSQQVLADLDEADRVATALHATPRGTLRLHASMNLVRFLAPIVSEFLTLYPAVALELTVGERMPNLIEDGFDLAIRTTPPPDFELTVRRLTPWRHVLCCAPSYLDLHPIAGPTIRPCASQLPAFRVLSIRRRVAVRRWVRRAGFRPDPWQSRDEQRGNASAAGACRPWHLPRSKLYYCG